ncbi:MAG: 2,3-bisphosphoglycerate-independent phosphoglycerate mutase [Eubacteriales bacterium]
MKSPTMLMILDGFGCSKETRGNAIALANTPNLDKLFKKYDHSLISASGMMVGLPDGQMGNSEVGHLNLGAGRIVYQELTNITQKIKDKSFFQNEALLAAMDNAKSNNKALHLIGLLSDGGVHSHIDHLVAILELAKKSKIENVYIHAILDGRDTPPDSGASFIDEIQLVIGKLKTGKISTVMGRYFAMDRDHRWDRVSQAYEAMSQGFGRASNTPEEAVKTAYSLGETDEFVKPAIICSDGFVEDGDSVVFFNFRPDRARELTRCFVDPAFDGFVRKKIYSKLCFVCLTQYDSQMPNVKVAFMPQSIDNTLGQYLAANNKTQLRIAETEKYAHVTFFFNGGVETPNPLEDRLLIPSPLVATYDLEPQMSAEKITDAVIGQINRDFYDVIIMNFANCDMVGHTGVLDATIKAIETIDNCVEQIVAIVLEKDGTILLTADHGNAEKMLDDEGNPFTAHTSNPVPFMIISNRQYKLKSKGILADVAPTLLEIIGLKKPVEMTGNSLIK